MNDDIGQVYSVRITDAEGDFRLGPYFTLEAARNQASRALGKGSTVHSIDKGTVEWETTSANGELGV